MAGDERRERLKRLREEAAAAGAVDEEKGATTRGDGNSAGAGKTTSTAPSADEGNDEDDDAPVLRFRNYAPTDKRIQASSVAVPAALAPDAALPAAVAVLEKGDLLATVGAGATFGPSSSTSATTSSSSKQQQRTAEEDAALLAAVAPKKPAWDLKRDIAPKLAKLERRTRRVIVELVREKAQAATATEAAAAK